MAPITCFKKCNVCDEEEDDIGGDFPDPECGHNDFTEGFFVWGGTKVFPSWAIAMEALDDDEVYETGIEVEEFRKK